MTMIELKKRAYIMLYINKWCAKYVFYTLFSSPDRSILELVLKISISSVSGFYIEKG